MIRILVADSRPEVRERLRAHLTSDPEIEVVAMARDGQEALQMAHRLAPDIALLAAELPAQDGLQTIEFLDAADDLSTQCILLSDTDTPGLLKRAMRAGAKDCLVQPVTSAALLESVREVYTEEQRRHTASFTEAANPNNITRVIPVTGAKGGIGKTTLSTNLAVCMAQDTGQPTVLIDLYTQFGDVGMLLNATPRRTLIELTTLDPGEIDAQLLEDCMERHDCGLSVLQCARTPAALDAIPVPFLEHMLGLLKRSYRYIVLDVPPILHATTLHALSHATTAVLVGNPFDITTVHDTRRLLDTLESRYVARENIRIVLNRVSKQNRLQISDIENGLGRQIAAQIPNDGKIVPGSINDGVPFVISHPNSPVAQSVRQLARSLTVIRSAESVKPAEPGSTRKRGLFAFGRSVPAVERTS